MTAVTAIALGGWLLTSPVTAAQHPGRLFGLPDGQAWLLLVPLVVGAAAQALVRGPTGWLLASGGVLAIFAGAVADLPGLFRPPTVLPSLAMLLLLGAGAGLLARLDDAAGPRAPGASG